MFAARFQKRQTEFFKRIDFIAVNVSATDNLFGDADSRNVDHALLGCLQSKRNQAVEVPCTDNR